MENRAVMAIMDVLRQKFSNIPEYKILADKWNVSGIEFVEMGKSLMGEFLTNEGRINLNYKFKESLLMTLNYSKPVDSIEIYGLYTSLHESIHSIESGKYFSGIGETLEEAITGSLSRMWLKDFLRINGLQASDRFIDEQTPFYGYYKGYSALKSLVEYLPGTEFRQYCLQLKMAKTTEARIAKLRADYREYIALRLGAKSSELPAVVDEILNDLGKNELYSDSKYGKILKLRIDKFVRGYQNE